MQRDYKHQWIIDKVNLNARFLSNFTHLVFVNSSHVPVNELTGNLISHHFS